MTRNRCLPVNKMSVKEENMLIDINEEDEWSEEEDLRTDEEKGYGHSIWLHDPRYYPPGYTSYITYMNAKFIFDKTKPDYGSRVRYAYRCFEDYYWHIRDEYKSFVKENGRAEEYSKKSLVIYSLSPEYAMKLSDKVEEKRNDNGERGEIEYMKNVISKMSVGELMKHLDE